MGIFKFLERKLVLGDSCHDYGRLGEVGSYWDSTKIDLLLKDPEDRMKLIIKAAYIGNVDYFAVDVTESMVTKLEEVAADLRSRLRGKRETNNQ
jgi:hypothetical protein